MAVDIFHYVPWRFREIERSECAVSALSLEVRLFPALRTWNHHCVIATHVSSSFFRSPRFFAGVKRQCRRLIKYVPRPVRRFSVGVLRLGFPLSFFDGGEHGGQVEPVEVM